MNIPVRPLKPLKALLADLPQPVAAELAEAIHYRKGDKLEVVMDPGSWEVRIRNEAANRSAALNLQTVQELEDRIGKGNNVFLSVWEDTRVQDTRVAGAPLRPPSEMARRLNSRWGFEDDPTLSQTIANIPPPPKPTDDATKPILVLAYSYTEARDFAENMMGWDSAHWRYVASYLMLSRFEGCSLYVVGDAYQRSDYESLEKLFSKHEVMDMNE